ncbi:MAG: MFS transporter [Candidatus Binatia bacterium]|nr:MFS transporter [Candidatus Binatia bacterium]
MQAELRRWALRLTAAVPDPTSSSTPAVPSSDRLLTRNFLLACAMQLFGSMAGALYILFPLFVRSLGGTELTIGVYAGIGAAAAVGIRWPLGFLLDRLGRKRIMLAATGVHAAASFGFLGVTELGALCALLVVAASVAAGAMFTSFVTYASDVIPVTRRAQGLAWFGLWGMASNGLSPLLGEWLIRSWGFAAYFLAAATLALACLGVIALLDERGRPRAAHPHTPATLAPAPVPPAFWPLMALTFLFGAAEASVFTFLAPYVTAANLAPAGTLFFAYAGTAVFVRIVSGHLPDRIGRYPMLAFAFVVYGTALFLLPRAGDRVWLHAAGSLAGMGHGYAFPILAALVVDLAGSRRGRAVSWFTAMFDLGHTLSNPALGAIAEHFGYRAMYSSVGILAFLAGCAVASRALPTRDHRALKPQPARERN